MTADETGANYVETLPYTPQPYLSESLRMGCFPQMVGQMDGLTIRCQACGHKVRWSNEKAVALLGYSTGPVFAAAKLKCSACGAKEIAFD